MDILGRWQIKYTEFSLGGLGAQRKTREEYLQSKDREDIFMATTVIQFNPDGTRHTFFKLPDGVDFNALSEKEKARLSEDRKYFRDETVRTWKEENGKFYVNRTTKGDIMGKELSPWIELQFNEDGSFTETDVFANITYERVTE